MSSWLEQHKGIVLGLLSLVTLIGGAVFYTRQPDPPPLEIEVAVAEPTATATATETVEIVVEAATATPQPTGTPSPIRVYIAGEVNQPDVYYLPVGSIIKDAIAAAGGVTDKADLVVVNLAQELKDQQQITIPMIVEDRPTPEVVEGGVEPPAPALSIPAPSDEAVNDSATTASETAAGRIININTASLQELTLLTGIGPAIGQRIIDHRSTVGSFATIEAIMDVKGIGPATFEKIKNNITIR